MSNMELLRTLVTECLSVAAEEIFRIIERTIVEHVEEVSHSKWVVDSHHGRLLDAEEFPRSVFTVTEVKDSSEHQQPAAKWNPSLQHGQTQSAGSEQNDDHQTLCARIPDSSLSENSKSDQEILTDTESSSYQCQFCDRYFFHQSDLIVHTRIHMSENLVVHMRKHTGEKSRQCRDSDRWFCEKAALDHPMEPLQPLPLKSNTEQDPASSGGERISQGLESDFKTCPLTIPPYDKSTFNQESLQPLCLYQLQTAGDIDNLNTSTVLTANQIKTEPADQIKTEPVGFCVVSDPTTDNQCIVSDPTTDNQCIVSDPTTDYQCIVSDPTTDNQCIVPKNPDSSVSPGQRGEGEEEMRSRQLLSDLKHLHMKGILPNRGLGSRTFEVCNAQKSYKCPHCSKCFSLTKTLIRHIKIHTVDKSYRCQFCGRNFCQKSDLVTHTRTHTGERPYQCQECQKTFAQKGNLVVHMRKHTREKPYQCQECGSSFSYKPSLHCHMQSHR